MARANQHQRLTMTRGDTATWMGQMQDPDTDQPVPLAGTHLWWTVKHDNDDDDSQAVMQKTETTGITVLPGSLGFFQIGPLSEADTKSLPNETVGLVWDIQLLDIAGNKITCAKGTLLVTPETTAA